MQPGQQQPPAYQQGTPPQQQPAYQQGTPQQQPMAEQQQGAPQQTMVVQQQGAPKQQTMVVQQQPEEGPNATPGAGNQQGSWCWKGLRVTGYMQVVVGILAVVFGIISIAVKTHLHQYGTPIWCGLCFLTVTGVLGIVAGRKEYTGLVIAYLVMSTLSVLAACGIIGVGAGAIETDIHVCPDSKYSGFSNFYYSYAPCSTSSEVRVGIDVCILLIGIAEIIIALVAASFAICSLCYMYKCCVTRSFAPRTMMAYYPQQMATGAAPQGVYYPPGTVVYQPQGQFQPPPQGQYQPPPQGQFQPPPQGQFQPPPQGQFQPPPQGQFQPPPQGQFQPPPQENFQPPPQEQVHPGAPPLDPSKGEDRE